ncbi:winged helix DNA-binding domain-containing protein [Kitasatospora atroaurantiaca]|uniref:winged helix DNA-binding domain-containing protein n=1 Tax=Kitasatospora atroaurantiaca TaxID=285545 RepID=UPI0014795C95|nr:winged helix DNA-binding domain-containing protein [Kitasatospora atroaurantiaca]
MTDDAELLRRRMHAQFLPRTDDVAGIARRAGGIQAQDAPAARLALRARGLRDQGAVARAYAAGEVVCSWLMRGTLHLVPAEDLAPLLALLGQRNLAATARRRRELGLTEEVCRQALAAIPEVLGEPLGRADLIAALIARGVQVDPKGQAPAHLTGYAAAHGLICRGADVAPREPGYRLLPPPPPVDADRALAELARRYAAAFGPAGPADFAAWAGLTQALGRRAFALAELMEAAPGLYVAPDSAAPPPGPPLVRLLGAYDTYLLGYRDREPMLDRAHAKRINAGGGVIKPALVVDGRVLGTWRKDGDTLVVERFARLPAAARPGLEAEAADIGRFLGEKLTLQVVSSGPTGPSKSSV